MADILSVQQDLQGLAAARAYAEGRERLLRQSLGAIRKRQSLQPEVQRLLEQTQQRLHQKTVGMFEDLLTSLNRDVLQGDQIIRLLLEYGRGAPDLTLCAQRGADQEDLWDGNGGALTNVVSTGLRIIALARSGLRPFLLLDEADNWCAPEVIPRFFSVFEQLAETMQLQTLFITHHDPEFFGDKTNVLRVVPVDEKTSEVRSTTQTWTSEQPGIRWIELTNVRLHAHSRLELSPGANALIGPNGHGKSTLASALRGVAYGEASSGLIRHQEDSCEVSLGLEKGQVLTWTRYRKASPRMRWVLQDGQGQVLHESTSAKGLPEWLEGTLTILRKEKLDIQLLHQKTPVFLLNEPGSKQASILSVGQESEHLPELMQRYRALLQSDAQNLRQGEEELSRVVLTLAQTEKVPTLLQEAERLSREWQKQKTDQAQLGSLCDVLQEWERVRLASRALSQQADLLDQLPSAPKWLPAEELFQAEQEWVRAAAWSTVSVPLSVEAVSVRDIAVLDGLIQDWAKLEAQSRLPELSPLPDLPLLRDTPALLEFGMAWAAEARGLTELQEAQAAAEEQVKALELELEQVWGKLSNCPVCGQSVQHHRKGAQHVHG